MENEVLSPVNDWIFKLLFGDERRKDMLINLLKIFIELPEEEYELTFLDTHLKPETEGDKLGILDVKVRTKSGKIFDIEIQVLSEMSDKSCNLSRYIILLYFIKPYRTRT